MPFTLVYTNPSQAEDCNKKFHYFCKEGGILMMNELEFVRH